MQTYIALLPDHAFVRSRSIEHPARAEDLVG